MDYMHLISGSDLRGQAVEAQGKPVTLDCAAVYRAAAAFVRWLSVNTGNSPAGLSVALGHDSRVTARKLLDAAARGIEAAGAEAADCELSTTPAMFYAVQQGFDGAIMLTASHLPFDRNGLKFITKEGGLTHEDIRQIAEMMGMMTEEPEFSRANPPKYGLMDRYSDFLRQLITAGANKGEKPLSGMKIAVDAGNGAGGFFARDVLEPLGADVSGSICIEPDGMFPNHAPNPELPEAMEALAETVISSGSALGISFDADCDRAAIADSSGAAINRNRLIALVSAIYLREHPGAAIVTDSVTSSGLAEFIAQKGGRHYRFKRGYKNVIQEALRLNSEGVDCPVAIETSGHCALRENHFLDDGAYLAAKLVIEASALHGSAHGLGSLIAELKEPVQAMELRFRIAAGDFRRAGREAIAAVENAVLKDPLFHIAPDNHEGLRVETQDGWFLIRMSLHDPLIVVNIESDKPGQAEYLESYIRELLAVCDGVEPPA